MKTETLPFPSMRIETETEFLESAAEFDSQIPYAEKKEKFSQEQGLVGSQNFKAI